MIKLKIIILAAALVTAGMERSAHATLVTVGSGTAVWNSFAPTALTVKYGVDLTAGVYTYAYSFVDITAPPTSVAIGQFEIDANFATVFNGALPASLVGPVGASTTSSTSIVIPGQVFWTLPPLLPGGTAVLAFTSTFAPMFGSGSALDGSAGPWSALSPGSTKVNVPVPEPTTLIAGALLLLPFGASTLRFVRNRH
jgi:hypothetical protein